eukprot:CAMPEP_0176115824 /NCGR_PEP_ID=MMETSP0120_2-20121206/58166_1 /TAXON_ID=160619 /ORGANISM="Kryptoperidinium foliaceum, Strain CCMP 1326" /LENGTH=518 /DNA_ID=CAMNT_0017450065 /DNA_START=63 /DNA_END=1619 /DNA_ORIENTATION=+
MMRMGQNSRQRPPIPFRALEKVRVRPQSLVQICLRKVAENFLSYDGLDKKLGKKQLEDVYAMLDLNMSLPEAATRIADESYWKRRTQAKHRNAQVEKHGMSWKQTFLELELQDALEKMPITLDYDGPELEALRQQVMASRLHVFKLVVGQFPSHIDLSFLFDALPALCSFSVTYGNRRLGMDYERAMFGMKISDAQYLARNIRVSQTLVSLSLPCNMIDDELVKVLMGGLSYGHMLTHLDLSHNKIGDRGARRLASLLDPDYCLYSLDLSDNQIHANGCMHIGAHLAENMTCTTLNLRLNRCEDNGVSHLFQDVCVNKYLKTLNISCNDLTVRCLPYMNAMIADNSTLTELDLSANPLHQPEAEDGAPGANATQLPGGASTQLAPGRSSMVEGIDDDVADGEEEEGIGGVSMNSQLGVFARCLLRSTALLRVDVRQCGLPPELAEHISTMVKHRELRAKGIPVEAYVKSKMEQTVETAAEEEAEGDEEDAEEGAEGAEQAEGAEEGEGEQEEKAEEEN